MFMLWQSSSEASHAGFPLLADTGYGAPRTAAISRHALHAWVLNFQHQGFPVRGLVALR